ncbi:MAG: TonB-dependent receptor, partial [Bryobacter sp.]|nr:TonB-dependent receptor [Bryobacter sp.]
PLERAGDFSQTYLNGPVVIYDNIARTPFPGNKIPSSRVDPAARGLLDLYPLPNLPGIVQNWQLLTSVAQNQDTLGFRLNRSLTKKDRLAGNVNWQWRDGNTMQLLGFRDRTQGSSQSLDVTWIRNQKPGFVITTRGTFNRSRNDVLPFFAFGPDYAAQFGIQGTSRDPVNYGPPNLNFTNYATLADGVPVLRKDLNYAFSGNVLRARGRHNFTAGGEWRRIHLDNRTETNPRGSYSFSGLATSGFDLRGQPLPYTGYDFADFLVGRPQSSNIRFGNDMEFRGIAANVFAQDDWRIRPNLTLNLGIRYEYASPFRELFRELQGRMANLDIAPDFTGVAVVTPGAAGTWGGIFPTGLIDPDRNNFAPRLGLAYKPFKRRSTLFRAGYGWYYNETTYSQLALRLAQQPPFAKTNTLSTSVDRPLTITTGFTGTSTKAITNTFGVDRSLRIGYAQSWSASLQQDLPFSLVVELGYLATKGTRLDIQRQPNRAAPGSPLTAEERRRIGNAVGFTWDSSEGNSILHSSQLRVTRRFKRGLSVNFNYVYGKTIDNASTFGGGGATVAQNDRDLSSERGLSSFDRRHTMNLNWVFTTVSGRRASKSSLLYRDWTFSGGFQLRSGGPMTARVLGNRADSGGTGVVGAGRAEATGESISSSNALFNLDAFTLPPSTRFGNAGRNTIPLPAFSSVNLSLARTFRLGDGKRGFDFRVESNNLLNQVSLTRLATTVNALNYGLPLNAAPMRTVQGMLRFRF